MAHFGTILAAEDIKIDKTSAYLLELGEMPILTHLTREMEKCVIEEWSVVLGHDYDLHRRAAESISATMVIDEDWRKGFKNHARRGLDEMPPQADSFIILPGYLPFFTAADANSMIDAFKAEKGFIIVAKWGEKVFPYPLMHRKFFGEVKQRLNDDKFFEIIKDRQSDVYVLEIENPFAFHQVRTSDDYMMAKEIFYKSDEYDSFSNPQSRIPQ